MTQVLPKLRSIAIKDRVSIVFLEKGELDVVNGSFILKDEKGVRVQIPVGSIACLMLEPGTRVSHAAVVLAARVGCLLVWTGEGGVRLYAAGQPGGARSDKLLYQMRLFLDEKARLSVVRKMYEVRFGEAPPERRSIDQLRGIEGARVRQMYMRLAQQYNIKWDARRYDRAKWDNADIANRALSSATSCLYGITEAAILAAGYAPAVGFIHTGKPLSFVYDIADIFKFETVVPVAFSTVAHGVRIPIERAVRIACRDAFRSTKLLHRIIPTIEDILDAGKIDRPKPPPDMIGPLFDDEAEGKISDDGYRS